MLDSVSLLATYQSAIFSALSIINIECNAVQIQIRKRKIRVEFGKVILKRVISLEIIDPLLMISSQSC